MVGPYLTQGSHSQTCPVLFRLARHSSNKRSAIRPLPVLHRSENTVSAAARLRPIPPTAGADVQFWVGRLRLRAERRWGELLRSR
jgi:hypothetical protein